MGLRLDGVEKVSSVGMDRNYTEPRRPRSREHNRRSSYEKNHRVSGERGRNGSRPPPVPIETPLSVVIAKNDNFENGHYSTPKSGYNHLLDEDFTKKALDVSDSRAFLCYYPSFVSCQFWSINVIIRPEYFIQLTSEMDLSTPNQVSMSVRRYARQDNPHLPEKMRNFILEGTADTPTAPVRKNTVQSNKMKKDEDGDATDYDDLDDTNQERMGDSTPSSSNTEWLMDRGQFIVMDTRIGCSLDITEHEILRLTKQLESLESLDEKALKGVIERRTEEEGCARLIPWDNTRRRKLMRLEDKVFNTVASTSKEINAIFPPPFTNRGEQYIHRTSIMSSYHIRKNKKKSIWYNTRELEEEKTRNGVKKKEEREKREKRKLERAEKEEEESDKSDEYEATDDDDDEMPTPSHSKKWNGGPKEKRRRKDADRKSSRREHNKNRRTSDCGGISARQVSVTSRPSFDGDMDYLTPSFNHSTWLEHFKNQRGSNFTYNKIPVPECRKVEIDNGETDDTEINPRGQRASRAQRGTSREEREASQESGRSQSTPSNRDASEEGEVGGEAATCITYSTPAPIQSRGRIGTSTRPPIPPFNYDSIRPITDYQRVPLSTVLRENGVGLSRGRESITLSVGNISLSLQPKKGVINVQERGFRTKRQGVTGIGMTSASDKEDGESKWKLFSNFIGNKEVEAGGAKWKEFQTEMKKHPDGEQRTFAEGYVKGILTKKSPDVAAARRSAFIRLYILLVAVCLMLYLSSGDRQLGSLLFSSSQEVRPEDVQVTLDDVRGMEEAKKEVEELVEYLADPDRFSRLGGRLPKGVLLVGPPGTGKTLLARAIAGEAGVPFFHTSGSEFDEVLVGQGARRVRDLFDKAKGRAPCIIFIDEIDSVGAKRVSNGIHPYANQTINQLLSEMDGFHRNEGIIVIAATNRVDDLDKALLRPGRFDVRVNVPKPDIAGRKDIFNYYLSKVVHSKSIDAHALAKGTSGFTGADIESMINQAALKAAREDSEMVEMEHLDEARDRVLMGPARTGGRIPDELTNKNTAYHEAGHTLVAYYTKCAMPLHKVTIIPRGSSMGHTAMLPEKDEYQLTKQQMLAQLDVMMGGRVAEELIFGEEMVTTGAADDLRKATQLAVQMVKNFGMSEKVGLRDYSVSDSSDSLIKMSDLAPATAELIDQEISRVLIESYRRAKEILVKHKKEHALLAEALLEHETLSADDIKAVVSGKSLKRSLPQKESPLNTPHPQLDIRKAAALLLEEAKSKTTQH
ncbi:ymel-1 [Pristionchus pacificus]|uniref:Ymel-1 n=1 Tax=Pristionchus pacificus TaxID=54126 RepID=A0A2A6BJD8_PRIPA|nr:ymel-1 [Pristionchus pacificus]|eukprot:PDM65963.1 ymel-1 [Pristionchus pacificus]